MELLMRRALPIAVNQNCRQGRPISVSEEHSDSLQMPQRKIISMKPGIRTIAILTALLGFGLLNGGRAADVKDEKKPAAAKKELFKNLSVAEFDKLRADHKNVVLDVGTPQESDAGPIGVIAIPLG